MLRPATFATALLAAAAGAACSDFGAAEGAEPHAIIAADGGHRRDGDARDAGGDAPDGTAGAPLETDEEAPFVADSFSRTRSEGFGSADVGGSWMNIGAAGTSSVSDGAGHMIAAKGTAVSAHLGPVLALDLDIETRFAVDTVGAPDAGVGSGVYVGVTARQAGSTFYSANVVVRTGGALLAGLSCESSEGERVLVSARQTGVVVTPGELVRVRFEVTGAAPTRLRVKLWRASDDEPEDWAAEANDDEPVLQAPGHTGVNVYLSSSAVATPVQLSVDEFVVRRQSPAAR